MRHSSEPSEVLFPWSARSNFPRSICGGRGCYTWAVAKIKNCYALLQQKTSWEMQCFQWFVFRGVAMWKIATVCYRRFFNELSTGGVALVNLTASYFGARVSQHSLRNKDIAARFL